jgi:hypothetical protein
MVFAGDPVDIEVNLDTQSLIALSSQLAPDVPSPSVKHTANVLLVSRPVVSYVTTELEPCAAPECRLSALAAATVPSAQGKSLFNVSSTSDTHLSLDNAPA